MYGKRASAIELFVAPKSMPIAAIVILVDFRGHSSNQLYPAARRRRARRPIRGSVVPLSAARDKQERPRQKPGLSGATQNPASSGAGASTAAVCGLAGSGFLRSSRWTTSARMDHEVSFVWLASFALAVRPFVVRADETTLHEDVGAFLDVLGHVLGEPRTKDRNAVPVGFRGPFVLGVLPGSLSGQRKHGELRSVATHLRLFLVRPDKADEGN
jgi:hypothetical protein